MLVTLFGIETNARLSQSAKAADSIRVMLSGISILVRPRQPLNALLPMLVTLVGITVLWQPATRIFDCVSMIALQLLRLSYTEFNALTETLERLSQPLNAPFLPIFLAKIPPFGCLQRFLFQDNTSLERFAHQHHLG